MQSDVACAREAVAEPPPSPIPARVAARCPAIWDRIRAWAETTVTAEKREEVGGIIFILLTYLLTGWFYYTLYQTLQDYKLF